MLSNNGATPVKIVPAKISGQNLAKARRARPQRIRLAESLAAGRYELHKPTLKQAAALTRVPVAALYRARQARKPRLAAPSLGELLRNATPSEKVAAARTLGVDRVWDEMVLPLVGNGKPAGN